jgi:toxin ParE1/3/4
MTAKGSGLAWAPRAEQDVIEIWRYLSVQASVKTADDVLRRIRRSVDRIAERPLTGRARDKLKPGLRSVLADPYIVFYRMSDHGIEVVRVLHQRRNLAAALSDEG